MQVMLIVTEKKEDRRPHLTSHLQTVHREREEFVKETVFNVYLIMKIKTHSGFHILFFILELKHAFPVNKRLNAYIYDCWLMHLKVSSVFSGCLMF